MICNWETSDDCFCRVAVFCGPNESYSVRCCVGAWGEKEEVVAGQVKGGRGRGWVSTPVKEEGGGERREGGREGGREGREGGRVVVR